MEERVNKNLFNVGESYDDDIDHFIMAEKAGTTETMERSKNLFNIGESYDDDLDYFIQKAE